MIRGVLLVAIGLFTIPAWSQKSKKATSSVLFSVNNRAVTSNEFIYLYRKNHPDKTKDYTKQRVDEYLDLFVNFKLKVEEARSRGIDTTKVFLGEYTKYKEELRRPYLPEGRMVDSLVRLTYQRLTEEIRAAHLLIAFKPDAAPADTLIAYNKILELKTRAQAGENFGELAFTFSEDPSAKINKGDLGYFTALQMVYPFENAAYQGKPGEVVGPVKTRFGYHLLHIVDRKPARGEVEVSHIMIRSSSESEDQRAKNLIFDIYDQVKGGASWDELCAQYSEDANSKSNGGRLRPFGVGAMAAAPEFDRVAFSLEEPGEISDPFKTAYGWHVVRLERKIPLPSFEELAPSLKTRVMRDERVQLSKQALLTRLKKEFAFQENQPVKTKIVALADTTLTRGRWNVQSFPSNEIIITLNIRPIPANEFIQYVKSNQRTTSLTPGEYILQLYGTFVEAVMNEAYEEKLIRSNPDYEMLLREYYEGILLFDIMEKEVWNKASEDTVGQRTYFDKNASRYQAGERVKAELYSTSAPDNLKLLQEAISKQDTISIDQLVNSRKIRYEKGNFQRNDRPVLAKIDWKTGDYTVENNGLYYLARISELLPPGLLTYEEAKAQVIADYQNYLEKEWVEQLKLKYPVKINEKTKQTVYKQLVQP